MALAGYKMISIMLLVVLVALAGGSPVFATDNMFITLTPAAACPGATVGLVGDFPGDTFASNGVPNIPNTVITSDPAGLVAASDCRFNRGDFEGPLVSCVLRLSDSASCGRYTVTLTLPVAGITQTLDSASATFDVAGPCCAVGGCVQPVNTFALLSPWLLTIGLVGCIGTVVVVAKKRRP
jgi:hypothetical protein